MTEYIRDPRFKAFGCGYLYEGEYGWVNNPEDYKSLDWSKLIMVAHNVKFDGAIFAWKYGIRPAMYLDTQSLARAILGNNLSSVSLKNVGNYLGLPEKGELSTDGLLTLNPEQLSQLISYNQRDLEICKGIDDILGPKFPQHQLWAMDHTVRMFIDAMLELDVLLLDKITVDKQESTDKLFEKLGIAKEDFSSAKKFAKVLTERGIEVPLKKSPRTGKMIPALSKTDQGFVALKDECPELYEARLAAKSTIITTRSTALSRIGRTGAFPFDVQFSGALNTHRYSGGNGAGGNPQNFPKQGGIREAIKPPKGYKLVVGDYSSIEAREVAWLAKDKELINIYETGGDPYSHEASKIFGKPINKKDHPKERAIGKEIVLGLGYGMGGLKLQTRIKQNTGQEVSVGWAYDAVDQYRESHPGIPNLWDNGDIVLACMAEGQRGVMPFAPFIRYDGMKWYLPSGLPIHYPNLRWGEYFDKRRGEVAEGWHYDHYVRKHEVEPVGIWGGTLIENICQGLVGDICKLSMQAIELAGYKVVGQVHDEVLAICKKKDVDHALDIMTICMSHQVSFWPQLKLVAEVGAGDNWAEAKPH
jgi:DNA polymerase bacteriophage-type